MPFHNVPLKTLTVPMTIGRISPVAISILSIPMSTFATSPPWEEAEARGSPGDCEPPLATPALRQRQGPTVYL